ncbi:hypothetical protein JCM10207_006347 [Rhodosporidiobolus poonsookiae]
MASFSELFSTFNIADVLPGVDKWDQTPEPSSSAPASRSAFRRPHKIAPAAASTEAQAGHSTGRSGPAGDASVARYKPKAVGGQAFSGISTHPTPSAPKQRVIPLPPISFEHESTFSHSRSSTHSFVREVNDDLEDAGYTTDEYASAEDNGDYDDETKDVDDERPFPSPSRAIQERYVRRSDSDKSTASEALPLTGADVKGKGKATSAAASWADPSLLPPPHLAPAVLSPQPAYATSPPPPSLKPSLAGLNQYYAPPVPQPSAKVLVHPDAEAGDLFPRGRNRHPRLLWRSLLDADTLAVLDDHHARVVGGPLPRLAVVGGGKLGASGVERERDHAGVREEGERGRSRQEKPRWRYRREWSVEGQRWSDEVERCGL